MEKISKLVTSFLTLVQAKENFPSHIMSLKRYFLPIITTGFSCFLHPAECLAWSKCSIKSDRMNRNMLSVLVGPWYFLGEYTHNNLTKVKYRDCETFNEKAKLFKKL